MKRQTNAHKSKPTAESGGLLNVGDEEQYLSQDDIRRALGTRARKSRVHRSGHSYRRKLEASYA